MIGRSGFPHFPVCFALVAHHRFRFNAGDDDDLHVWLQKKI
jgi:hypothetical protein